MKPRIVYYVVLVAMIFLVVSSAAKAHRLTGHPRSLHGQLGLARAQVRHDRASADPWLRRDRRYVRQLRARLRPFPAWWLGQALCVKSHEGGWRSNTGNGFYGGLQFAATTWRSNGGGRFAPYAHLASPLEQLTVAYWLWRKAGWAPWPNTSRMCGLR